MAEHPYQELINYERDVVKPLRAALREAEERFENAQATLRLTADSVLAERERVREAEARVKALEGESAYKNRVRAEAAERKVDEYRQLLDEGWRFPSMAVNGPRFDNWKGRVLEVLRPREAPPAADPRQDGPTTSEPRVCICGHDGKLTSADCRLHGASAVAEPERDIEAEITRLTQELKDSPNDGAIRQRINELIERLAEPEREGFTPPKEGAER